MPQDLESQVSVYADEAGIMDVLAPTGWECTASLGADGSVRRKRYPPGEVLPDYSNGLPAGSTDEAIVATQNGGCQGCADEQACPFFAAAAQIWARRVRARRPLMSRSYRSHRPL